MEPARHCCEFTRLGRRLGFPVMIAAALALLVLRPWSLRRGSPVAGAGGATSPMSVAAPEPPSVSDEAVAAAIEKAKTFLSNLESTNRWEVAAAPESGAAGVRGSRWGMPTALAAEALQTWRGSQAHSFDGECRSAADWLQRARVDDPATLALRSHLYELVLYRERATLQRPDIAALMRSPAAKGPFACDLEICLTVARCLEGADHADRVPEDYWATLEASLRKCRQPDGSWCRRDTDPPSARVALTANAAATLLFVRNRRYDAPQDARRDGNGGEPPDQDLDAAMAWLDAHAAEGRRDPEALFAVQRLASAGGRGSFGGSDWYNSGAAELLARQNADGSWPAAPTLTGADPAARLIPETAYAVLFLSAGQTPVMIDKLIYDAPRAVPVPPATLPAAIQPEGDRRPADVAHFVAWGGPALCGPALDWRQVRLNDHSPSDSYAPLLYVSGGGTLAFTPAEEQLLRAHVGRGGLILGNADGGSREFAEAFTALGGRLFPGYSFRELPPTHVLFNNEMYKAAKWRSRPKVLGLSNGVRELMLLVPDADLGRTWQERRPKSVHLPAYELGLDIVIYANGRNWLAGRWPPCPRRDTEVRLVRPVKVARLIYPGNADPEPAGWERLAILMHNQFRTDLTVSPVKLGGGQLNNGGFQVAHLTGADKLTLTDAGRAELTTFVKSGGTLIVDAAGGSEEFARSAAAELGKMFPQPAGTTGSGGPVATEPAEVDPNDVGMLLPASDPVYLSIRGATIDQFPRRRWAVATGRRFSYRVPGVRGIAVGGAIRRTAVFFSPEDLSAGLTGTETDGILGYQPDTATAIMRNLLLYATAKP